MAWREFKQLVSNFRHKLKTLVLGVPSPGFIVFKFSSFLSFHKGFTNERRWLKADRASQTYAWPACKPVDIIRARAGLERTPGDIIRGRADLGRTPVNLLELLYRPYRPTLRDRSTDRPTVRARLGLERSLLDLLGLQYRLYRPTDRLGSDRPTDR